MDNVLQIVQTLGFPISCVIFMAIFVYKYINRIMDESKEREEQYQNLLVGYGEKMAEICSALAEINKRIDELMNK